MKITSNRNRPVENRIDEYDMTKKMIDIMSGGLREAMETAPPTDPNAESHNDGDDAVTPTKNDQNYADEIKKFSDTVDPRVQITNFKIYPKDRDVKFEGRLDSGINFFMSLKAMKLSISITDDQGQSIRIFVDDDLVATIQKLSGYYENWSREWAQKLVTDYPTNG